MKKTVCLLMLVFLLALAASCAVQAADESPSAPVSPDNPPPSQTPAPPPTSTPPPSTTTPSIPKGEGQLRELGSEESFPLDADGRAGNETVIGPMLYPLYGEKIGFLDQNMNLAVERTYSGFKYHFYQSEEGKRLKCVEAWKNTVITSLPENWWEQERTVRVSEYISPDGHISDTPPEDLYAVETRGNLVIVNVPENPYDLYYYEKCLFNRTTREKILDETFAYMTFIADDLILAQNYENLYLLNALGQTITSFPGTIPYMDSVDHPYGDARLDLVREAYLSEGKKTLIPLQETEGKIGYVNLDGKWIIPPQFATARPFIGEKAVVAVPAPGEEWWEASKYYFIDKTGAPVDDHVYSEILVLGDMGYVFRDGQTIKLTDPEGHVLFAQIVDGRPYIDYRPNDRLLSIDLTEQSASPRNILWIDAQNRTYKYMETTKTDYYETQCLTGHSDREDYYTDFRRADGQSLFPVGIYNSFRDTGNFTIAYRSASDDVDLLDMRGQVLLENIAYEYYLYENPTPPGPYIWITKNHIRGYVDTKGRWVYRELAYDTLDD